MTSVAIATMGPHAWLFTMWQNWAKFNEQWFRTVFSPASHHAHDSHTDLEVPDPIEENGEHDLFA